MDIIHLYGYVVPIPKLTTAERTHDEGRLGLNSKQYFEEDLEPYLLPLLWQVSSIELLEVIEDAVPSHTSKFLGHLSCNMEFTEYLGQPARQILVSLKIFWVCSKTIFASN